MSNCEAANYNPGSKNCVLYKKDVSEFKGDGASGKTCYKKPATSTLTCRCCKDKPENWTYGANLYNIYKNAPTEFKAGTDKYITKLTQSDKNKHLMLNFEEAANI